MNKKLNRKRNIILITVSIAILLLIFVLVYFFGFYSKTVARVDGIKVKQKEVDVYMDFLKSQDTSGELPTDEEGLKTLEANIIDSLIVIKLLEKYAGENDITVTDQEVDERMELIEGTYSSEGDFEENLEASGISKEFLEDYLRNQLLSSKIYNAVTADVTVSEDEVKQYYEDNKNTVFLVPEKIRASHILAIFPWKKDGSEETQEGREEALSKIEMIQEKLENGEDFGDLALQYSDDTTSAEDGGDLGFISKGEMVEEFEEVLFALDVGETSGIVETEYGFHIIEATDYEEEHIQEFSEVEESINTYLLNLHKMEVWEDFIYSLIDKVSIEYFTDVEGTLNSTDNTGAEDSTETGIEDNTDAGTEDNTGTGTEEESE